MDPDLGPLAVVAALALAFIGRRKRAGLPEGSAPTVGQRAAATGQVAVGKLIGAAATLSRLGTDAAAGTLSVAGVAAAATVRTAGRITDDISVSGLSVVTEAVTRAGGLVVDGAATVKQGVGDKLHGR